MNNKPTHIYTSQIFYSQQKKYVHTVVRFFLDFAQILCLTPRAHVGAWNLCICPQSVAQHRGKNNNNICNEVSSEEISKIAQ